MPADGRLLQSATLEVAESALTGESLPVSKGVEAVSGEDVPLGDRTDMVFMNTNATRGTGEFVVTATGMATEVGHISGCCSPRTTRRRRSRASSTKLTNQILFIAGAAVAISMILNLSRGETFKTVFTAAIAFAISAIPTGLPAVVTTILSLGTQMLARANAIVKRLRSTETLGSTSAINSDKTGTLTLNQMTAVELTIPGRRYAISGSGYSTEGTIKRVAGEPDMPLEQFLLPMLLASDAVVIDGELIGDPTEGAARRARGEGRPRRGGDARGVPARGRAAVRLRLQADGDVPSDAGRGRAATSSAASSRARRTSCSPAARSRSTRSCSPVEADDDFRERYMAENTAARRAGPARAGDGAEGLRSGHVRPERRPAPARRGPDDARARRASSTRRGRRRRRRSRGASRPASRCG